MAQHWDGTQWSIIASANGGSNDDYLYGVAALASNDVWAVGQYREDITYNYRALVERYGGPCPTLTPTRTPTRTPTITPTPGGDGWSMFGHDSAHTGRSRANGPNSANLHWDLTTPEIVGGVTVGPDGTIYGSSYNPSVLYALHPNGTIKWQTPLPFTASISGVPAIGADGVVYAILVIRPQWNKNQHFPTMIL